MVYRLDSVTKERAHRELVSHQMVGHALAWWQGIEDSMLEEVLAIMILAEFRMLFKAQYILCTTRELIRDQFRELSQGGMSIQAYAKKFTGWHCLH